MAKILYIATSDIHLATFHRPYIQWFVNEGHQVDLAFERRGDFQFEGIHQEYLFDFPRNIAFTKILNSYKQLKGLIDRNNYDIIHCHTPIPSLITRLAARKARAKGSRVLYTAHGFHFYKGGPLINWLVYYPIEYVASMFTDAIIVLNKEDYGYIIGKMRHKASYWIPGIGVDAARFTPGNWSEISQIRASMGYHPSDFIILYIAEFIPRKNHEFILRCMPELKRQIPHIKLVLAGRGILLEKAKELAQELQILDSVDFLGFRLDVERLCAIADVGVSSSKHEGLGLGVIEQMMGKVPVVASVDRGHNESIKDGFNGFFFRQNDKNGFMEKVVFLANNPSERNKMGQNAWIHAQNFERKHSLNSMVKIYTKYLASRVVHPVS